MYQKVSTDMNFAQREEEVIKFWRDENIFKKTVKLREGAPAFTFFDGPPTANGKPHIGHVETRAIKDIIPRYRTMKGYSVLRKAGPLTRPEWEEMRRHPVTGYEILRKIDDFKEIAILVRHHHERWDGRGYPDGLSGHDIPPGSCVIAVADSIDAMMSSRSYRPAMTSAACRREIEKNSGIMYDPRVAAAALEHWDELVSRYAGADTPRTPYFDRLQLEHTRQAHDYLLTHQGSRITLPELAAKFHLSQSSLKICFKALYGVPVASYLRGLRMDTAARLLQESDLPVAEIAHRVGYEDPSRFAAAFRRHTGRRPTELRRVACPTASSHTA